MMNLLKDPSRSIQFEAFHVFKVQARLARWPGVRHSATLHLPPPPCHPALQVFVANPNKTRPVVEILFNNKDKLLKYLDDFHNDRGGWALCGKAGPRRDVAALLSVCGGSWRAGSQLRPSRCAGANCSAAVPLCPDADDEQFKEEKAVIIKEISLLQPAPPQPAPQ